jgi:hypothetical protein
MGLSSGFEPHGSNPVPMQFISFVERVSARRWEAERPTGSVLFSVVRRPSSEYLTL